MVATVAVLVLVELAAGLVLRLQTIEPGRADTAADPVATTLANLHINPAPVMADPDLLWSNVPGATRTQPVIPQPLGRNPTWTARINSEGFRGGERAGGSHEPFRILCIGDSVTFGFGVDQSDTWPEQLARRLREHYPAKSFEVINAGVSGWSWLQGLRFLELRGLALNPHLTIIGHGSNDLFIPAFITDEERLLALGGPLERLLRRLAGRVADTNFYRLVGPKPDATNTAHSPACLEQIARRGSCRRVPVEQIEAAVEKVSRVVAAEGVGLLVVNTDFLATGAVKASRAATERLGLPFEDVVAGVTERRRNDEDQRAEKLGLAPASRTAAPAGAPAGTKNRILVRVLVPDRSRSYTVEAKETFGRGRFSAVARDDGAAGDEAAGDSVFTAALDVPARATLIEYRYLKDGAPEFTSPLPIESTLSGRILPSAEPGYAPVDVFADALFMVERTHPNARGHAAIAEMVERRTVAHPSFQKEQ
jgi:lysophospholipase L1-like esterase